MNASSEKPLLRPTWATVNLSALAHNYRTIERHLNGKASMMAMVKADAYGHGAVAVSRELERCGVRALGVATVEEGMELRAAGIGLPILVMGGLLGVGSPASREMIDSNLTPVIHSSGVLSSLDKDAERAGRKVAVHLKIDTGMSRLGVRPEALGSVIEQIKSCRNLFVEGVMTHLAEADSEEETANQMELFLAARERIEDGLGPVPVWHVANSTAIMRGRELSVPGARELWVRPGLALYGECGNCEGGKEGLRLVMELRSRAVLLKNLPAGARVSYGGTFTTRKPARVAVVPIGYADGYPWRASGKAFVLAGGRRRPVIGRVTMDMIVVDVTDAPAVEVGDEVVLLGAQGGESILLCELADWAGTIPYEILCGISKRMPRIYKT